MVVRGAGSHKGQSEGLVFAGISGHREQWPQGSAVTGIGGQRGRWSEEPIVAGVSGHSGQWSQGPGVTRVGVGKGLMVSWSVVAGVVGERGRWSEGPVATRVGGRRGHRVPRAAPSPPLSPAAIRGVPTGWCQGAAPSPGRGYSWIPFFAWTQFQVDFVSRAGVGGVPCAGGCSAAGVQSRGCWGRAARGWFRG